jgi:hypothetical protein
MDVMEETLEQPTDGFIKIISQMRLVLHIKLLGTIMVLGAVLKLNARRANKKDVTSLVILKFILSVSTGSS